MLDNTTAKNNFSRVISSKINIIVINKVNIDLTKANKDAFTANSFIIKILLISSIKNSEKKRINDNDNEMSKSPKIKKEKINDPKKQLMI